MKVKDLVIFNIFYNDIEKGTKGVIIKEFKDYVRVYFGKNLGGQKLTRLVPKNILTIYEENNKTL